MEKIEVKIKDELFAKFNAHVDRCAAFNDISRRYIEIYGDITLIGEFDHDFSMYIKVNICDSENNIIDIAEDRTKKQFYTGYESFSIIRMYSEGDDINNIEVYPCLLKNDDSLNLNHTLF